MIWATTGRAKLAKRLDTMQCNTVFRDIVPSCMILFGYKALHMFKGSNASYSHSSDHTHHTNTQSQPPRLVNLSHCHRPRKRLYIQQYAMCEVCCKSADTPGPPNAFLTVPVSTIKHQGPAPHSSRLPYVGLVDAYR